MALAGVLAATEDPVATADGFLVSDSALTSVLPLPSPALADAIRCAVKRREALTRFCDDARLEAVHDFIQWLASHQAAVARDSVSLFVVVLSLTFLRRLLVTVILLMLSTH